MLYVIVPSKRFAGNYCMSIFKFLPGIHAYIYHFYLNSGPFYIVRPRKKNGSPQKHRETTTMVDEFHLPFN